MTELPTTFGKYYLTEKLATGGMAEIYLAKLIGPGGFEKSLVIKQIHPRLSGHRHFVDLFVAEAKTLVALAHGNIVPVYELGVVDDTYFIAMEYIDGPTLYRLTERMAGRDAVMEPNVAAWITARILEGLDYAHRKGEGVIHRDLSPRNVMMSRDGEVKLVDFGIAVTLGEPGEGEATQSAPTGSFPYMSPEQVRREPLSGQTDLFSAGVLCWEMLVGKRLFGRPTPDETLEAVLRGEIARPSTLRPDVPPRLDEVVMRALERDQTARWPNAGEMLAALNRYLYSLDETPGPRDVAALVAKYCPPESRRLPTHLEAIPPEDDAPADASADASAPVAGPATAATGPVTEATPSPGPSTAVIPRDRGPSTAVIPKDGSQPKGKRPQRHQTFATNVELEGMLSRATPLFPIDAIREPAEAASADGPAGTPSKGDASTSKSAGADVDEPDVVSSAPDRRKPSRADRASDTSPPAERARETAADRRGMVAPALPVPGRTPPSRAALIVIGFGGLALSAAAVYVFYQGRSAVLGRDAALDAMPDAGVAADAPSMSPISDAQRMPLADGQLATPTADAQLAVLSTDAHVAVDAHLAIVTHPDAASVVHMPADAASIVRMPADAAVASARDAAALGTATLSIGADPWGEIMIDGKKYGATPKKIEVSAGHHTVVISFPAETPPRTQTFAVDLSAGETEPIQADFH